MPYTVLSPEDTQRLIYDCLSDESIQKFETTHELDFGYAVKNLARFRWESSLRMWLFRVARNQCMEALGSRTRRELLVSQPGQTGRAGGLGQLERLGQWRSGTAGLRPAT